MKYYKQRTRTDCLLTVAENLVQRPREKFGRLSWNNRKDGKYLKYSSFSKILREYAGGGQIVFEGLVKLDYRPAILGHVFRMNGSTICHSFFWDCKNVYCPARGCFVNLNSLDIRYVFLHPRVNHDKSHKNIEKICKDWDIQCSDKRNEINYQKPVESLMSLSYNGRVYPGDLERANKNIEINF